MRAGCLAAVLLIVPSVALAETTAVLASKYARYQSCMENALGNVAYQKLKASAQLNKWGVPTAESIEKLPPKIRESDATCRRAGALAEQRTTDTPPPLAPKAENEPQAEAARAPPLPMAPAKPAIQPAAPHAPLAEGAGPPVLPSSHTPPLHAQVHDVDFDAATQRINQSFQGSAAVDVPSYVKTGKPFTVYLRVAPGSLAPLLEGLKGTEAGTVAGGQQDVRLMPLMTAAISGLDFKISPADPYERAVSPTETTTWEWQVEATKAGLNQLQFDLYGTLKVQGEEAKKDLFTYGAKVDVAVDWAGVLEEYWQWIATTLLIPAAAGLWALFRQRRTPRPLSSAEKT
jgi:hypothetical protein